MTRYSLFILAKYVCNFFIIYAPLIFAVCFVVSFERLAKTFQVLKIICGRNSRSYFNLFLIYAVTHDARRYKPSQI